MTSATCSREPSAFTRLTASTRPATSDTAITAHRRASTLRVRLTPSTSWLQIHRRASYRLPVAQEGVHVAGEHLERHAVAAALRQDQVGVLLGGLHVEVVHGLDRAAVLRDHALGRAAALVDVALEPPDEALVRRGVNEHLQVHAAPQLRGVEHQY